MYKKTLLALVSMVALVMPAIAEDNLNHFLVIWVITKTEQLADAPKDDPYKPGSKLPVDAKKHPQTIRLVCAKEWKTKAEAVKFMEAAPADVKLHMHLINEDE